MAALKHVLTTRRPNGGDFFHQEISSGGFGIYIENLHRVLLLK